MFRNLALIYACVFFTAALCADADFCEEDKPCDEEEEVFPCPFCPTGYYGYDFQALELEKGLSWPSKREDPFLEALSR